MILKSCNGHKSVGRIVGCWTGTLIFFLFLLKEIVPLFFSFSFFSGDRTLFLAEVFLSFSFLGLYMELYVIVIRPVKRGGLTAGLK
jgi:hypothetical protein